MSKVETERSLDSRLDKHFMLCAGAAAVASGAILPAAEAAIVYSGPQSISVETTDTRGFYLNFVTGVTSNSPGAPNSGGLATPGFDINIWENSNGTTSTAIIADLPAGTQLIGNVVAPYAYAGKLAAGAPIGPGSAFLPNTVTGSTVVYADGTGPLFYNNWKPIPSNTQNQYLGLKFTEGANTYYGWLEMSIDARLSDKKYPIRITGWAYDDVPNTGVNAGVVPEPASAGLMALAMGALGMRGWRKNRVA